MIFTAGGSGRCCRHVLETLHRAQESPPPPPAKMAPVLPIPNMRYDPAAAEMVTDKDRAGEPCVWHVEEAGVQ